MTKILSNLHHMAWTSIVHVKIDFTYRVNGKEFWSSYNDIIEIFITLLFPQLFVSSALESHFGTRK